MGSDVTRSSYARRTVLSGLGLGVATAVGVPVAVAQEGVITSRAVIPEPKRFDRTELPGFFVHVDPNSKPTKAQVSDECDYADWPAEATLAYDVRLIDRVGESHTSEPLTLYAPDRRSIPAGGLYVINTTHQCEGAYVGIEIEQLDAGSSEGFDSVTTESATTERAAADDMTTESGSGFGVLAGLASVVGAGWLIRDDN